MAPTNPMTISANDSLVDNMFAYINRVDDELKVVLLYKSESDTKWSAKSCGVQDCLFDNTADWDSWKVEDVPEGVMSADEEDSFESAIRKSFEGSIEASCSKILPIIFINCPIITKLSKAKLNIVSRHPTILSC